MAILARLRKPKPDKAQWIERPIPFDRKWKYSHLPVRTLNWKVYINLMSRSRCVWACVGYECDKQDAVVYIS